MKHIRASLRFTAFTLLTLFIYSAWWISSFFIPNKQLWRQTAFKAWCATFVRLSEMEIEVIGEPPSPPFFLVTNHLSYTDIPALRMIVNGVFVAKHDIRSWFVAGRIVGDMGTIFIDRGNRRDIPRAGQKIIHALDSGEGVVVFPEGTSTKGETVLPFNSSFFEFAARAGLPVRYAAISYRTARGEMPASDAVCWWDDTTFLAHMYRLFSVKGFQTTITFGNEAVAKTNRKELAEELRQKVREHFIPVI